MKTVNIKPLVDASKETMSLAKDSILETVSKKKWVIEGSIPTEVPKFPSKTKKKQFQQSLGSVMFHPTMKNINLYFHHFYKMMNCDVRCKVDFSDKEKAIKKSREDWKLMVKKVKVLREIYVLEKGDFYKR